MKKSFIVGVATATFILGTIAQATALTLTNRDDADHRLKITEGTERPVTRDMVVKANQTLEGVCKDACSIALENGDEESFEGNEIVRIENGRFVLPE